MKTTGKLMTIADGKLDVHKVLEVGKHCGKRKNICYHFFLLFFPPSIFLKLSISSSLNAHSQ